MVGAHRPPRTVQRDFAVAPTTPNRSVPTLSDADMQAAIAWNQARHTDPAEIEILRDVLGVSKTPAVIDEEFVNGLVRYQAQFGLTRDGRMGHDTADRLAREIRGESDSLPAGNSLTGEFACVNAVRALLTAGTTTYASYKTAITATTMVQQHVALRDETLLRDLDTALTWNDFARCVELMGRSAPTGSEMIANANVRAALATAWAASNAAVTIWPTHDPAQVGNACNPPVGGAPANNAHEEGGFIYLNLITGAMTTRAVAAGAQAALLLENPPNVADSVAVGGFHTHPNVGNCWGAPFFSGADGRWATRHHAPLLMRGAFPAVANTTDHATGNAREHLAGPRGLADGGALAPQAPIHNPELEPEEI